MTRATWGEVATRIEFLIRQYGPMTRAELCAHMNRPKDSVASVISRMSRAQKETPKRLYVCAYVFDQEGERRYPRAVYALGDKPDKPRPNFRSKAHVAENRARWWAKKRKHLTMNSVFNLGLTKRQLQAANTQPVDDDPQQEDAA